MQIIYSEEEKERHKALGAVGGRTAAQHMTAKRRSERARKAAESRWATTKDYSKMTRAQKEVLAYARDRQARLREKNKKGGVKR